MLQKSSGYQLGQGVGKSNQGILNPIEAVNVGKGGVGTQVQQKPIKHAVETPDNIDMDINNLESSKNQAKIQIQKAAEQKQNLDKEDKEFLQLLKNAKKGSQKVTFAALPQILLEKPIENKLVFEDLTGANNMVQDPILQQLQNLKQRSKQHVRSHMNKQVYLENQFLQIENQRKSLQSEIKELQIVQKQQEELQAKLVDLLNKLSHTKIENNILVEAKKLFDQNKKIYTENNFSFSICAKILNQLQISQGLEHLELFLYIKKILEIQLQSDEEVDEAMYFVFDNYWMPVFSAQRNYKTIKEWSNLMPETFKQKFSEQIISAWLKVRQDKDSIWAQDVCNWQFLLKNIIQYFNEWLNSQNRLKRETIEKWLNSVDQDDRSQMQLQIKNFMVQTIGKRFKVEPLNQDISLLSDLIELKDYIDVTDIVAELVAPKLLATAQIWLNHPQRNLKEIWIWYQGWKKFIIDIGGPKTEEVFYLMCLLIKQQLI